ncbi:TetR family transcriptional regulator [Sphingomonas sp. LH128]|uniref:TetR/AcrR family transcriptional regulator n=1 Tax=Sphingomonas sp. LH128 TaxID=473781 RepID=UPI00027CC299|nr:TetR/AcrR family transcriptional regulator [Sphingomonas sp. LH128]EJU11942.1 TetR family transcriptional regulator [Sphingomonas sp. LH128]
MAVPQTRRCEKPDARRDQIIEEAFKLIGQRGYHAFTIGRLAKNCGLSNAGIVYYFGSKASVLVALLDVLEARDAKVLLPLVHAVEQSVDANETLDALRQLFRAMAEQCVNRAGLDRFAVTLQSEAIDPAHPAHYWFRDRERMLLGLFRRLLSRLVPDAETIARQLVALMAGLAQQWLRSQGSFDFVSENDKALMVALRGTLRELP